MNTRLATIAIIVFIALLTTLLPPTVHAADQQQRTTTYRVRPGDTLSAIAREFGVSVQAIMRANDLRTAAIYSGQPLTIPVSGRTAPAPVIFTPRAYQLPSATPATRSCGSRYTVRAGDTLSSIARRCGTTVTALKQANGLVSSRIYVGQTLIIRTRRNSFPTPTPTRDVPFPLWRYNTSR